MVRNENKSKITILPALPLSWAQLHSWLISVSQGRPGDGKWGLWSIHDALCLLLVLLSSSIGSHMQETVLHKLLQCGSVLWVAVPHEFLQSPLHRLQPFRSKLLQQGSPFGPQILPENLLQHGVSMDGSCFQGTAACFSVSPPWAAGWHLRHHSPPHGLQGNISFDSYITTCPSYYTNTVSVQ